MQAGEVVISDRYVPSALVMQQLDGVDPEFLWRINAKASGPYLAVILYAESTVVADRLSGRGPHNRLQRLPSSADIEWHHYREVSQRLIASGWTILRIDCSTTTVAEVAQMVQPADGGCRVSWNSLRCPVPCPVQGCTPGKSCGNGSCTGCATASSCSSLS
jgi:thymidylate kinase